MLSILLGFLGFISAVGSLPCNGVIECSKQSTEKAENKGSLTLHYTDGTNHTVVIDSSSPGCEVVDLPNPKKHITKLSVAAAEFVIYSRKKGRGPGKHVDSDGHRVYFADEIDFAKDRVKSYKFMKNGCFSVKKGNASVMVVTVCAVAVMLVLAAVLVYRRIKQAPNSPGAGAGAGSGSGVSY